MLMREVRASPRPGQNYWGLPELCAHAPLPFLLTNDELVMFNMFSPPNDRQTTAFLSAGSLYRSEIMCSVLWHAKGRHSLPGLSFRRLCAFSSVIIQSLLGCNRFWNLTYWSRVTLSNCCTYINCRWTCQVTFESKMIWCPTRSAPAAPGSSSGQEGMLVGHRKATEFHSISSRSLCKLEATERSPKR